MNKKNIYAVEMINISKVFSNNIIANDNITLKVKKGEVHALVGENGAGKSTLMSILFGLYQPTNGSIKINGKEVVIKNSVQATNLKIGMVHQHFKLVDNFTVLQNIILGSEPTFKWQWINYQKAKAKIKLLSQKYQLKLDLGSKISSTTVGMQQRVEILKVLYREADIIVLDEPTAVLTPQEIVGLLAIVKELKAAGKTIIFISHKLSEVKTIADQVTVIRQGKVIESFSAASKSKSEIATLMVGRELPKIKNNIKVPLGYDLLKIEHISVKSLSYQQNALLKLFSKKTKEISLYGLQDFNLTVKAGEIVAIAGVENNGQRELVYSLTGLIKPNKGKIYFSGADITNNSVKKRYQHGMSYIPEDRHKYAVVLDFDVIDNMVLATVDQYPFSKWGFLKAKAIQHYAQKIIKKYDVRGSASGFAITRSLSGGNQQKAVVGRELEKEHKLLVVVQPTRGLDIVAINYIHKKIVEEKAKGNGILLISYELSEVMSLADRIVVLHSGTVTGDVAAQGIKREEVGLMMAGQKWQSDHKVSMEVTNEK